MKMEKIEFKDEGKRKEKPPFKPEDITWREFRTDEFWKKIPTWESIEKVEFLDVAWQEKNAITSVTKLEKALEGLVSKEFIADVNSGALRAPMAMRVTPYIISLIDWQKPVEDPLRRQFIPLNSQMEEDHPLVTSDPGCEQVDSPTEGLTHRYFDRVLFLTTDICPTYCRYCTRSYSVGSDTERIAKVNYRAETSRWQDIFRYIESRNEVEDVVISGGDVYRLKPAQIDEIGEVLLNISHIRRIRFATKGLAIQPMKIISDPAWLDSLTKVAKRGRSMHKEVSVHTHFNHPNEITEISKQAANMLFERAIPVRNLSVTLRGVNDNSDTLNELNRRLGNLNIRPYYQYIGDMILGAEDLRTSVKETKVLEKNVRGVVSGHNTPTFVLDAPGGGGKRDIHSHEYYDEETGISVYSAPSVNKEALYVYADPLRSLSEEMKNNWRNPNVRVQMLDEALRKAVGSKGG